MDRDYEFMLLQKMQEDAIFYTDDVEHQTILVILISLEAKLNVPYSPNIEVQNLGVRPTRKVKGLCVM
jgi:hypothetical protein